LVNALIALLAVCMMFQVAVAEEQSPSDEAPQPTVQAEEAPSEPDAAPAVQPSEEARPEAEPTLEPEATQVPEVTEAPEATETPEVTAAPEATEGTELVEIQDEQVPLAGGPAPTVTVRANHDLTGLSIGDTLTLTCELAGFSGLDYSIRWQALVNGQWKDLPNENAPKLIIKITGDNANWSYRAAVDAQPVV
jgi:outer membrane biosynthesis protein TonB